MGEEQPTYWQQQFDSARPPRAILWCGAHRQVVRAIGVPLLLLAVILLVVAIVEGDSVVSPIFGVLTWCTQLVLWGFLFPRQADEWLARHPPRPSP